MAETAGRCEACDEPFKWDDTLIKVNGKHYHNDCVELYPTGGYVAFLAGNSDSYLGETENDDGEYAHDVFEELLEDEEETE